MRRKMPARREAERVIFAPQLRQQTNLFSRAVWEGVRDRRMLGDKFRCEHALGPYTLDFVCLELMLDLEVDGLDDSTEQEQHHDLNRDAYSRGMGFDVLRIPGYQVMRDAIRVQGGDCQLGS